MHSFCIGSGLIEESAPLEAADAHHGGNSCVVREFLGSQQNLVAVYLLVSRREGAHIPSIGISSGKKNRMPTLRKEHCLVKSSLKTGPRFVETPAMTALGGYVTGTRGTSMCGAKTQQG